MDAKTTADRALSARMVFRFRKHLLENHPESHMLTLIDEVDPDHAYFKFLGWDEPGPEGEPEWRCSWDPSCKGTGYFGSWMNSAMRRWREQWAESQEAEVPLQATTSSALEVETRQVHHDGDRKGATSDERTAPAAKSDNAGNVAPVVTAARPEDAVSQLLRGLAIMPVGASTAKTERHHHRDAPAFQDVQEPPRWRWEVS
ncbi:hypothetical protein ColLi_13424 [Colletotrichum liriopes]|uniref:Uncharacterized protein n=1 Tax=Colletotrichum liriopes TaxID=708192 RepID=A0AA37H063_9PEZI|nr:hypothetical protein ColLi_13424 [Colletotrichum liriopes]